MKKNKYIILLFIGLFTLPINAKEVYLGGDSIGIQLSYEGLLITSTYTIESNGYSYNPNESDIKSGDTIKEIDGRSIETIKEMNQYLLSNHSDHVVLTLKRNNEMIYRNLKVIKQNDKIKTGLYVKDEIMGIGTLTYIEPDNKSFASLGHEIIDQDTKQLISLDKGYLFRSSVNDIAKAQISKVGEKQAYIHFDETIGTILKMNQFGVYGISKEDLPKQLIDTATQEEIKEGKAEMYTVLKNSEIEKIDIVVVKKYKQNNPNVKSFEFKIVDVEALKQTNGIVQGMSGSPVVQNGKLIGAVTHVSSKNPKYGYGVYIEWMLNETK